MDGINLKALILLGIGIILQMLQGLQLGVLKNKKVPIYT